MSVKKLTVDDFIIETERDIETGEDNLKLTIEQRIILQNLLMEATAKLTRLPANSMSASEFHMMYQKASYQCEVYKYLIEKSDNNIRNAQES